MSYIRDAQGVVINTDDSQYLSIKAKREEKQKLDTFMHKVDDIEKEMTEIKSLLLQIVNGKNYG